MLNELKTESEKEAQTSAAEKAAQRVTPSPELEKLLGSLKAPPIVGELGGARKTTFNQLLAEGEADLTSGKYIEAVNTFHHAAMMDPQQPLARVGLIHAQMGAGMVISAARDLRLLLDAHPELTLVRYDPKLLPPPQRLEWLRFQIQDMLDASSTTEEPALLLAYMGYQVNSPALAEYGLTLAQARAPADPLISFLRAAWLKSFVAGAPAATQP
jgi:hypothetical protein